MLDEVRQRGPLAGGDLPERDGIACGLEHSWFGTVGRAVLEAHFGRGTLAVADRRADFTRVYDLSERIIPDEHLAEVVAREDAQRELLRVAARGHGIGTAQDLADYFRMQVRDARPRLAELVESGELARSSRRGMAAARLSRPGRASMPARDRRREPVVAVRPGHLVPSASGPIVRLRLPRRDLRAAGETALGLLMFCRS